MRLFPTLLATGLCLGLAVPASGAVPESTILTHSPVGTQVEGSENQGSAPVLEPGMSQDMLPATGEHGSIFYKLPQIQDGERLHVSTQLLIDPMQQPTSNEHIDLKAALVQADGDSCNSSSAHTSRRGMENLSLVQLDSSVKDAEGYSRCLDSQNDELYLSVQRGGKWQDDLEIPLEIRVVVEPALDPTTLSGVVPDSEPPITVSLNAQATEVSGGSGFSNAAKLESGSVYSDSVLPFEVKYYKVHVAEGQRLNYRMTVLDSPNASAQDVYTDTFSPLLHDGIMTNPSGQSLSRDDSGASLSRSMETVVSRDLIAEGTGHHALGYPGDYYITVVGDAYEPRGLNPLAYELAIEVTGEPTGSETWEPSYDDDSETGDGLLGLFGGSQDPEQSDDSGSWLPDSAQIGALLGGAAVALAGFAGLWFLRRKNS